MVFAEHHNYNKKYKIKCAACALSLLYTAFRIATSGLVTLINTYLNYEYIITSHIYILFQHFQHNLLLNSYPDTLILGKARYKQPSINHWFCLSAAIFVLRFSFDTFGFASQVSFSEITLQADLSHI